MINCRELPDAGFDVHVHEREGAPGGNWHYSEGVPEHASLLNAHIAVGDRTSSPPPNGVELLYVGVRHGEENFSRRIAGPSRAEAHLGDAKV